MTNGKRRASFDLPSQINFRHKKPRKNPGSQTNETFEIPDMATPWNIAQQFAQAYTQVSKTKSEIDASGQHNKLRHVTWHLALPGKHHAKHKGVVNKIGHSVDAVVKCDAGVQKPTNISNFNLKSQLIATWTASGPTAMNGLAISPFDANVDERTSGNIISNAATLRSSDKVYIEKITGSLCITNLGTVPTDVWVYAYCTKTPNQDGPVGRWNSMNTEYFTGAQFPVQAVQSSNALSPAGDPVKGFPTSESIGYRPGSLPAFRKMFKTIGKLHITLMPGETTDLEYVIKVGKYFDKRFLAALPTEIIPYKTVQFMMIQQGGPVRTVQGTQTQRMHHSANCIGYINNHYYHVVPVLGENKTPFHIIDAMEVKTAYETVNASDKFVNDTDTVVAPSFTS